MDTAMPSIEDRHHGKRLWSPPSGAGLHFCSVVDLHPLVRNALPHQNRLAPAVNHFFKLL
jgi:hypothetical protein